MNISLLVSERTIFHSCWYRHLCHGFNITFIVKISASLSVLLFFTSQNRHRKYSINSMYLYNLHIKLTKSKHLNMRWVCRVLTIVIKEDSLQNRAHHPKALHPVDRYLLFLDTVNIDSRRYHYRYNSGRHIHNSHQRTICKTKVELFFMSVMLRKRTILMRNEETALFWTYRMLFAPILWQFCLHLFDDKHCDM